MATKVVMPCLLIVLVGESIIYQELVLGIHGCLCRIADLGDGTMLYLVPTVSVRCGYLRVLRALVSFQALL